MDVYTGRGAQPSLCAWQGDVDLVGDQVGEIEELQRALVGDHAVDARERKPSGDHVTVRRRWKPSHLIDAMPNALQRVALGSVVGQRGAWNASGHGLVRGKEPALSLGDLVQPVHHRIVIRIYRFSGYIRDNSTAPGCRVSFDAMASHGYVFQHALPDRDFRWPAPDLPSASKCLGQQTRSLAQTQPHWTQISRFPKIDQRPELR